MKSFIAGAFLACILANVAHSMLAEVVMRRAGMSFVYEVATLTVADFKKVASFEDIGPNRILISMASQILPPGFDSYAANCVARGWTWGQRADGGARVCTPPVDPLPDMTDWLAKKQKGDEL